MQCNVMPYSLAYVSVPRLAGGGLIVHLRDKRHVESNWLLSEYF